MAYIVKEDGPNYQVEELSSKKKLAVFDSFRKAAAFCSKLVNKGVIRF